MNDYPAEFDNENACEVCGKCAEDCICPECPVCGEQGNPACYDAHGLERTEAQVESLQNHLDDVEAECAEWEAMGNYYLEELGA